MARPLDLVFMGTPDFAATILAALLATPHRVGTVYAQPPRPAGRGHRVQKSPVQVLAEDHGIAVRCPQTLREAEPAQEFAALRADAAIVAAYGLILPPAMLAAPRLGCLNVHASLLPRWRGAAPIQRALLAGDALTGITIMRMEAGLDTGPILLQQPVPIGPSTRADGLAEELAALGARLAVAALDGVAAGTLASRPQPDEGVTYAAKLGRDEGLLDWRRDAAALERQVRALDPWPGAFFILGDERIRVHDAAIADVEPRSGERPGTVLDDRLSIGCGAGALRPLLLQRPGRKALAAAEFLRGFPIPPGTMLPCPATG